MKKLLNSIKMKNKDTKNKQKIKNIQYLIRLNDKIK